jgi:preprotein translocase subunit SecE
MKELKTYIKYADEAFFEIRDTFWPFYFALVTISLSLMYLSEYLQTGAVVGEN